MSDTLHPRPPAFPDAHFDVVLIAASAGGLRALLLIVSALARSFPAAVLVVLHLDPHRVSHLAEILGRHAHVDVRPAAQDEPVQPGVVYVAVSDRHLVLQADGRLSLGMTAPVHFVRPSADSLFISAAETYGPRALAVVLTGTGLDGSQGVVAIKRCGGTVLAQDPADAEFPAMPEAALATGSVDRVLPLAAMAQAIEQLVRPST